jgi:hypothetical protein
MGDEFETETGGVSEAELEKIYSGKYLGAADVGDRKIKTKILRVALADLRQQDGSTKKKAVLACDGIDKQVVVNVTNFRILKDGFGANAQKWVGRTIGIKTAMKQNGKPGIELVILGDAFKTAAAPMPTKKPAPKIAAEDDNFPADEFPGDPGPEPDPNRDFGDEAAF